MCRFGENCPAGDGSAEWLAGVCRLSSDHHYHTRFKFLKAKIANPEIGVWGVVPGLSVPYQCLDP